MNTILINTGTEILLGDVLNTHLGFIAREIFPLGLRIDRQIAVPDGSAISDALLENLATTDIVFLTGGLGPTTDDITRETAAELLGLKLQRDETVAKAITDRLSSRGWTMTDRILRQALVPEGATVLPNPLGTAPGLYLSANLNRRIRSPHLFLLPGPPRELQPIFIQLVMPILRILMPTQSSMHCRTYRIAGMGESLVERAIGEKILSIREIEIGYCAGIGEVELRIIGERAVVEQAEGIIKATLGDAIFSTNKEKLEEVIVRMLRDRKETVVTAESCTGGLLADRLTNVAGASAVFLGGFVVYANEMKCNVLGVDETVIKKHGAVSEPVAAAMAETAREKSGATYALATTGIAGPDGGSVDKPLGTLYIAVAAAGTKTLVRHFNFASDRETFKQLATQTAFNLLRKRLL